MRVQNDWMSLKNEPPGSSFLTSMVAQAYWCTRGVVAGRTRGEQLLHICPSSENNNVPMFPCPQGYSRKAYPAVEKRPKAL